MNYFTALGITVALLGGIFILIVLAVPIEVVAMYFTKNVQIVFSCITAAVYIGSFQWVKRRNHLA